MTNIYILILIKYIGGHKPGPIRVLEPEFQGLYGQGKWNDLGTPYGIDGRNYKCNGNIGGVHIWAESSPSPWKPSPTPFCEKTAAVQ